MRQCVDALPLPDPTPRAEPAYWVWAALFLAVAIFEVWAMATGHQTLSQAVQRGPGWFKWSILVGFVGLLAHFFLFTP